LDEALAAAEGRRHCRSVTDVLFEDETVAHLARRQQPQLRRRSRRARRTKARQSPLMVAQ